MLRTFSSLRLASGELKCIGSTTYHDYKSYFERDRALARRFQKIEVPEPSHEEAIKILEGLKPHYEKHHGVHYSAGAIRAAVKLSAKHINDRCLPDKAIDVIDEIGAAVKIQPAENGASRSVPKISRKWSPRSPRFRRAACRRRIRSSCRTLERDLKLVVFGQDPAIDMLASTIKLSRSGLGHPEKADRLFSFRRSDWRRQNRAGQTAG